MCFVYRRNEAVIAWPKPLMAEIPTLMALIFSLWTIKHSDSYFEMDGEYQGGPATAERLNSLFLSSCFDYSSSFSPLSPLPRLLVLVVLFPHPSHISGCLLMPHPAQVLAIFRILGLGHDSARRAPSKRSTVQVMTFGLLGGGGTEVAGGLDNHLVQVCFGWSCRVVVLVSVSVCLYLCARGVHIYLWI
jgi:hypothetical protein